MEALYELKAASSVRSVELVSLIVSMNFFFGRNRFSAVIFLITFWQF
jgi:hypothetical protein